MGVLIKGLTKPKSCEKCLFGAAAVCIINRALEPDDEMTHSCPLIEVSTTHGRLIDADTLLNKLQALYDERECEARYTGSKEIKVSWSEAVYQIINAPTIIQAEPPKEE